MFSKSISDRAYWGYAVSTKFDPSYFEEAELAIFGEITFALSLLVAMTLKV